MAEFELSHHSQSLYLLILVIVIYLIFVLLLSLGGVLSLVNMEQENRIGFGVMKGTNKKEEEEYTLDGSVDRHGNPAIKGRSGGWQAGFLILGKLLHIHEAVKRPGLFVLFFLFC